MLVTRAFVVLFGALSSVKALDNGLALTPPMAWNPVHAFGCNRPSTCNATSLGCISETQMKRTADLMVSEGYLAAGYQYLVIDACWDTNDDQGRPDPRRFPNGMKALADYIHGQGLKFGILGDLSMSEYNADVAASWGVDYFEAIGYAPGSTNIRGGYITLSEQINNTSRPMIIACSWPYLERMASYELIVGNAELTVEQAQIQMALWSIMAAPLIMSVDLAKVKPEYKDILLNRDIIDVDQDKLGVQGRRVFINDKIQVWTRKLSDERYAVAFVSLGGENEVATFVFNHEEMKLPQLTFVVRDLYNIKNQRLLQANNNFTVQIRETGVKFYKFIPY